jgi:Glycosyl transferase family 2
MKLVMTLRARDEADILDAQIAFHLEAGVDFFVATYHTSQDRTLEILESYERAGKLHLVREEGAEMDEGNWATRMSRLAVMEFGADWVIPSDADEFWWPRGRSLKEVLASVPPRYGVVRALLRHFVPRPDSDELFAERMTVRVSGSAPINDPNSLFRPNLKVIHRADPDVTLSAGAHTLLNGSFVPLRGWYPIEFFHFPLRSLDQADRKYANLRTSLGVTRNAYYEEVYRARESGRFAELYESLVVDDAAVERGVADGSLVVDLRLRDALRGILLGQEFEFPQPNVVDDAAYAIDVMALGEADLVRLQRQLDTLNERLGAIEQRPAARVYRKLGRLMKRAVGR